MQILTQRDQTRSKFLTSDKLPGDVGAAGPPATLCRGLPRGDWVGRKEREGRLRSGGCGVASFGGKAVYPHCSRLPMSSFALVSCHWKPLIMSLSQQQCKESQLSIKIPHSCPAQGNPLPMTLPTGRHAGWEPGCGDSAATLQCACRLEGGAGGLWGQLRSGPSYNCWPGLWGLGLMKTEAWPPLNAPFEACIQMGREKLGFRARPGTTRRPHGL